MIHNSFLLEILALQQNEIRDLKEKLATTSQNSSKPPSQDFKRRKKKKRHPKIKTGRKQGAQLGHIGITRQLATEQDLNNIINCYPEVKCSCGKILDFASSKYNRHQVHDLCDTNNKLILTEYRLYKAVCSKCNLKHIGELPKEIDKSWIGSNLKTRMSMLVAKFRLSKRLVVDFLNSEYNFKISVGTVSNMENRVSHALSQAYNQIANELKTQEVIHADETRHIENNKTNWAWVGTNDNLTVFMFDKSRGKKSARKLIGENFQGTLITDR